MADAALPSKLWRPGVPALVLGLCLLVTSLVWRETAETARAVERLHHASLFRQATAAIVDRLDRYRDVNAGGAGLFDASVEVTRREFRHYVDSLTLRSRHQGIEGIAYMQKVAASELTAFTGATREDGAPEYRVRPAGARDEYWLVKYVEPIEDNLPVLGLDVARDLVRRVAMEQARDEGAPIATAPLLLETPSGPLPGFEVYTPVYRDGSDPQDVRGRREKITGWIATRIVPDAVVEGVLATALAEIRGELQLAVLVPRASGTETVGGTPGTAGTVGGTTTKTVGGAAGTVVGGTAPPETVGGTGAEEAGRTHRGNEALERLEAELVTYGQAWTLVGYPGVGSDLLDGQREPLIVLGAGTALSLALYALVLSLSRTRGRAVAIARQMTSDLEANARELVESNRQLGEALDRAERVSQTLLEQHATLSRADRMAAVGEMAGGLAHELRNPLAGILMALGNLREECDDGETGERFDLIADELNRITRLLNRYMEQARHEPEPIVEVDLGELVDDLLAVLRHRVPAGVELVSTVEGLRWRLPRDRIRQALLNLVLNSLEALATSGNGGEVRVAASNAADEAGTGALILAVEDDGPGFPDAFLSGPVQPFTTGKAGGTGFGLAMVRRVARDLGGELDLSNRSPHGARAALRFPPTGAGAASDSAR